MNDELDRKLTHVLSQVCGKGDYFTPSDARDILGPPLEEIPETRSNIVGGVLFTTLCVLVSGAFAVISYMVAPLQNGKYIGGAVVAGIISAFFLGCGLHFWISMRNRQRNCVVFCQNGFLWRIGTRWGMSKWATIKSASETIKPISTLLFIVVPLLYVIVRSLKNRRTTYAVENNDGSSLIVNIGVFSNAMWFGEILKRECLARKIPWNPESGGKRPFRRNHGL